MLSKCANPECAAPFRNLKDGKVYVAEYHDEGDVCLLVGSGAAAGKKTSRREMFWMCGNCDRKLVLVVKANEVVTVGRAQVGKGDHPLREIRLAG